MQLQSLPEDICLEITSYLDLESLWKLIVLFPTWAQYIGDSVTLMLRHQITLTPSKCLAIISHDHVSRVKFRNVVIRSDKGFEQLRKFWQVTNMFKGSIEILELEDFQRIQIREILDFFQGFTSLRKLKIKNCSIYEEVDRECLSLMPALVDVHFEKVDGNFFKIFHRQSNINKITIRRLDWTWNGFAHDDFNDLVKALPEIDFIVMDGTGTGSYFDCDEFPYRIRKLDTTMISFHWYVGIRTERTCFLRAQQGYLKDLTIHQLPYDFDGGRVLKFIVEQMNLDRFYFGNLPLIVDGQIQAVEEFSANEIQLSAMFEMFRQFPTIKSLKLNLCKTDVDSTEIERIINPRTELFARAENLEVYDLSERRHILGVFLGLFKNFRNIKSLKIESQDGNINVILQEFLPFMSNLRELYINSKAKNETERLNIIRNNVPLLTKLWVAAEYVEQAKNLFGDGVEVNATEDSST
ncbi:uncharacterized protein [Chironomus tepperi]|uniref:uncharacterized protein n=1 Tax=Chironomus tepperi TaxID=113505 RepID=UPI00391FB3E1